MTKINPYLAEIQLRCDPSDLATEYLATLAVAHELAEANSLTEAINAPPRFVANSQNPIAPEEIRAEMAKTKIKAVPDDSGDARIAAAARDLVERYKSEGAIAKDVLSDLVETVERTRR